MTVTPPAAIGSDDLIQVGVVARAHGVRGELRVALHNPASTALDRADAVFVGGRELQVESVRAVAGGACLVRLAGVSDRDRADALRGQPVCVARGELELDDGEVLLVDLIGCSVELTDGTGWGVVTGVEPGPQDRLIIRHGDVERQLPVADEFLVDIDLDARRVVVDPPEGLPEEPISGR